MESLSGTYTATVSVDPSSTAVEGTHFSIPSKTININADGENFLTTLQVMMLTDGIPTPLATAPKLVLKISDVTGAGKIVASDAKITINLFYLCPSFLADYDYTVSGKYDRPATGYHEDFNHGTEGLVELGPGEFQTGSTGHWGAGGTGGFLSPPATYNGFIFKDVCGVVTIEPQNLGGFYSNIVAGSGTVDEVTGNIHLEYTVCASDCREFVVDYVRQ
jgi:hypothetical protein